MAKRTVSSKFTENTYCSCLFNMFIDVFINVLNQVLVGNGSAMPQRWFEHICGALVPDLSDYFLVWFVQFRPVYLKIKNNNFLLSKLHKNPCKSIYLSKTSTDFVLNLSKSRWRWNVCLLSNLFVNCHHTSKNILKSTTKLI